MQMQIPSSSTALNVLWLLLSSQPLCAQREEVTRPFATYQFYTRGLVLLASLNESNRFQSSIHKKTKTADPLDDK